jgi:hypothetical protein
MILLYGCVSRSEYNMLKNENMLLKKKYLALSDTPEYYYNEGVRAMEKQDYKSAMDSFAVVVAEYPEEFLAEKANGQIEAVKAVSKENYQSIVSEISDMPVPAKINYLDQALTLNYLCDEEKAILESRCEALEEKYEKVRYIVVRDVPLQSCRFIETARNCTYDYNEDQEFAISLYVVEKYNQEKNFRIMTKYSGNEWIFYDAVTLRSSSAEMKFSTPAHSKTSSKNSGRMTESYDYFAENDQDEIINELSRSESISVIFHGKADYEYLMNKSTFRAFKEIAAKY